jgi:predicted Zn-dependent peptidase
MKKSILFLITLSHLMLNSQTPTKDILNAKVHTLPNGLKVYMSINKVEPKIQTYIAVKAGSKFDPKETTGLAHYLEHLMFKGTPNLGTKDWETEKAMLDQISDLYEKHKAEKDPVKKKEIYKEIDRVSYEASKLAVPNEYDKIVTSLGAQGTNAYTSNDQTVYQNSIPSNEIEKWMKLESERFQHLTMRLFHTELEAVYEEYNISQDNDARWAYANLLKALYPTHPYGTQTTIGEGEHLKNPSHVNIRNYFEKYYVPNNVAICLSGDFDEMKTLALVEKYFGGWKKKDVAPFEMPDLPVIDKPLSIENFGSQEEFVYVGFRTPAMNNKESLKAIVLDQVLANGTAGLIDLNITQKQKALAAYSFNILMHDASVFALYGKPMTGQSLDDVKTLLLEQVEKVKKAEFDSWLIEAGINDIELKMIKSYETNQARAGAFVAAFTNNIEWSDYASRIAEMRKLTKQDIVDFANKYLGNNYAVSYKRKGKEDRAKVEKPQITPVVLNRDVSSDFFKKISEMKSPIIDPVFVDFKTEIKETRIGLGTKFSFIKNKENSFAKYCIIFPFGKDHSKESMLATKYIDFLGTKDLSNEEFKKELFKNGLEIATSVQRDKLIITLSGLEQNMSTGIKLLYDNLNTCKVDEESWKSMISNLKKERDNAKISKSSIFAAMVTYAKYGPVNPYNTVYSDEELTNSKPETIVEFMHKLTEIKHDLFFYGQNESIILKNIPKFYKTAKFKAAPKKLHELTVAPTKQNNILFYNYPNMVQAQIMMTRRADNYDKTILPFQSMYNDFFGSGLSSIVFQELREQKALAYSANSSYAKPALKGEPFFFQSFIGTQADKMGTAAKEFKKLMNTNPSVEIQFNNSKNSVIKQISSDRIVRDNIYWASLNMKDLGFDYDYRKDVLAAIKTTNLTKFVAEFQKRISNKDFTTVIMGDKSKLKMEDVQEFGPIKELDLKAIFGF